MPFIAQDRVHLSRGASLIRVMNGHIYKVPNRRKRRPELKPSEIPTLLGYTASLVDKKWLRLAARRNHG
ncbi:hypothetical protein APT94_24585 [Escherichia coli]|nr:hypothetical protein APT94_24585 [Escherichia coli]